MTPTPESSESLKKCTHCKLDKPLKSYSRHKGESDGRQQPCKLCALKKRIEKRRDPVFFARSKAIGKASRDKRAKENPEYWNIQSKRSDRTKRLARARLNSKIQHGKLVKPSKCEECLVECNPDGHHEDYAKPFEVKWLCPACHLLKHKRIIL